MPSFLHVGCGRQAKFDTIPFFKRSDWKEIRLDIDPDVKPDVIGSMTNMTAIPSGSVDAIYSSHNIEHLYAHEVKIALAEFYRVLSPTGFAVIACPDLQATCKLVAEGKLLEPAYSSVSGPISPLDIIYGFRPSLRGGNHFMAHHCGFTLNVLLGVLRAAGFGAAAGGAVAADYSLWAVGRKDAIDEAAMLAFTRAVLPFT